MPYLERVALRATAWAALAFALLAAMPTKGWTAGEQRAGPDLSGVQLHLELDDSIYAEHQPIVVMLTASASEAEARIPSMRLEDRFVSLSLTDSAGHPVQPTVDECIIRGVTGPPWSVTVAPGESQVEIYNLLFEFGGFIDEGQPLALSFGQHDLRPGDDR